MDHLQHDWHRHLTRRQVKKVASTTTVTPAKILPKKTQSAAKPPVRATTTVNTPSITHAITTSRLPTSLSALSTTSLIPTTTSTSSSSSAQQSTLSSSIHPSISTKTVTATPTRASAVESTSTATATSSGGLSTGSTVGIVLGALLAVTLLSFSISFFVRRWRQSQSNNAFEARQFRRSAILLDDQAVDNQVEQPMIQAHNQPFTAPVYPQPTYGHVDVPYTAPYQTVDTNLSYPESYYRRQVYPTPNSSNSEPTRVESQTELQRKGTIYNSEDAYGGIS